MPIHKAMRAAIKVLSNLDIDVKKTYRAQRRLARLKTFYIKPQGAIKTDILITDEYQHKVEARLYTFPEVSGGSLIFLHGGGWATEDIDTYDKVCFTLTHQTDRSVLSVNYRLAPEHRFPAAVEDCFMVVKKVLCGEVDHIESDDITLIGDSAGGNLAAAVTLMLRDKGLPLPARQILIYPSVTGDHTDTGRFPSLKENGTDYLLTTKKVCDYMDLYQSSPNDITNPYFAPLDCGDFTNLPPLLVITAEFDPLRDEGEAYGMELRKAGNQSHIYRIKDALHGFFGLPLRYKTVQAAYELINCFLNDDAELLISSEYASSVLEIV